ncbi:hypothetical protein DFJ74DRAFT_1305 [Hyaloraphidium curvatum]|nr:hypothetical protein DFJ74DRAFT_1305 [Hyaloraphidium curvatum]
METVTALLADASAKTGLPKWLIGGAAAGVTYLAGRALLSAAFPPRRLSPSEAALLPVVVTGCDTGFGNLTAIALSEKGFKVYAGCLTDAGIAGLQAGNHSNLTAFKLDVTKDADVASMRAMLEKECPGGIYCLVNNAGLHAAYKWELSPMDLVEKDMAVNYFGAVRVGVQLAPLLRLFAKSNGDAIAAGKLPKPRLVIVTSSAGWYPSSPYGPYAASKHAARVFAITFRQELAAHGVLVSSVEPFFARTPFITVVDERKIARVLSQPPEVLDAYNGAEDIRKRMSRSGFHTAVPKGILEPSVVVDSLVAQTELWKPQEHAVVGTTARILEKIAPLLSPAQVDGIAANFEAEGLEKPVKVREEKVKVAA